MKKFFKKPLAVLLASVIVASAAVIPTVAKTEKKKAKNYVEGEVIAVLNDNAASKFQSKKKAASVYGSGIKLTSSYTFSAGNKNTLKIASLKSSTMTSEELVKKLKKNESVKYAFPNFIKKTSSVTKDTYSDFQWALKNTGQNNGKKDLDTKADKVWNDADKSGKEKVVAIIDTGIDYDHEDLKDVVWNNPYGSKLVGKHGYDYSGTIDDGEPYDDNGHGSHCAGIIAGKGDNNIGISGINKKGVKIMALKFLDSSGSGSDDDALACFDYIIRAKKLGTDVCAINCSWGGAGEEEEKLMYDELFDELGEMGIITCVAAGNESSNIDEDGGDYNTPASSDSRYCLTVGASTVKDELASFSNYGKERVDIAAPGTEILSSVSYNCFNPSIYSDKQIEKLCANFQNYNGTVSVTDFGYPNELENAQYDDEDEEEYEDEEESEKPGDTKDTSDFKVKTSSNFFGKSGKSISITNDSGNDLYFEIPFKVDGESENYSVSFMYSSDNSSTGEVYDVPADYTYDDIFGGEDWDDDDWLVNKRIKRYEDVYCDGGYWAHFAFGNENEEEEDEDDDDWRLNKKADFDDEDTEDEAYYNSGERKLVFHIESDSTVYLDDLAISKTDADEEEFGKYDFYNGTSMATPYVTGAVALVSRANPDSSIIDVLNMVRNTGRESKALEGQINTESVLSLDNLNNIPPFITGVAYDESGKLKINGSFRNISSVMINDKKVTPEKVENSVITVPDDNYNTRCLKIRVINDNGRDYFDGLLSEKKSYSLGTDTIGAPEDTSDGVVVNGGDSAYYIDANNKIGTITYDSAKKSYVYKANQYTIDFNSFTDDDANVYVNSAVMNGKKIYFSARIEIVSPRAGKVLGYDGAFGYYDLESKKTVKLDTLDGSTFLGSSVAVYNNDVYLIGGYDFTSSRFSDAVYKMGPDGKLAKTESKLPVSRAYSKFIEYGGKLIGMYGAQENGDIPQIITFDGTKWTQSNAKLESEDSDVYNPTAARSISLYRGNLGFEKKGIFCNGAYCYGLGDTFTYNPASDSVTASEYSFNNELHGGRLLGTTVPGAFIGFNSVQPVEEEEIWIIFSKGLSKNSFKANGVSEDEINTFTLSLNNGAPKSSDSSSDSKAKAQSKKANPIKVKAKAKTIKAKKLNKKKQTVKALTVSKAQGAVTFAKVKKGTTAKIYKKISVNKKTGKITIKKGKYSKKTYKVKIKVTAKGNANYKAKTVTKVVKIKVK